MSRETDNRSKIIDGHAFTDMDTSTIDDLDSREQEKVLGWIRNFIYPGSTVCDRYNSYALKGRLVRNVGISITHNMMKDAMLAVGYKPIDETKLNWHWRISLMSPAFRYEHCISLSQVVYDCAFKRASDDLKILLSELQVSYPSTDDRIVWRDFLREQGFPEARVKEFMKLCASYWYQREKASLRVIS